VLAEGRDDDLEGVALRSLAAVARQQCLSLLRPNDVSPNLIRPRCLRPTVRPRGRGPQWARAVPPGRGCRRAGVHRRSRGGAV
jgi:hypothetical protein